MDNAPPRLVTEGLMELGALVCTPASPKCGSCPVSADCEAFLQNRVAEFPVKKEKPPKREESRIVCLAIDHNNRVLLRRRTERLLQNMWEFPAEPQLLADGFAVWRADSPLGTAKHVFTHIVWHMTAYKVRAEHTDMPGNYRWAEDANAYALPSAMKAWVGILGKLMLCQ
jgi:A/G-specific adenine glycosylase